MSKITAALQVIETDAGKALAWLTAEGVKIEASGPAALAALGVLLGAVETALSDTAAAAANPGTLIVNLGSDLANFKAVWSDVKAFAETLGIKL